MLFPTDGEMILRRFRDKSMSRAVSFSSCMPYPTHQQFLALLRERKKHEDLVEEYLLTGVPFAFKDDQASHVLLLSEIAKQLAIGQDAINVIGSGRIGFSLDPEQFGKPFSEKSDLDVAIVSDTLFDEAWMDMLRLGKAYHKLRNDTKAWLATHRQSCIYWGFVRPEHLPGVVRFSSKWFFTFKGLSRIRAFASRPISGRLYRTRDHLVFHQKYSCNEILKELRKAEFSTKGAVN